MMELLSKIFSILEAENCEINEGRNSSHIVVAVICKPAERRNIIYVSHMKGPTKTPDTTTGL